MSAVCRQREPSPISNLHVTIDLSYIFCTGELHLIIEPLQINILQTLSAKYNSNKVQKYITLDNKSVENFLKIDRYTTD